MILVFPDLDTLTLSLTAGIVPPAVQATAARAGFGENGEVVVKSDATLSRKSSADLKQIGVTRPRKSPHPLSQELTSWHQILPLLPTSDEKFGQSTNVLFELSSTDQLIHLVSEILRLGNDRQSFRHFAMDGQQKSLLRVVGPPYYSLLNALDRSTHQSMRAYVEQQSRVWVELGYKHPHADRVVPPPGKILLLQHPTIWSMLDEAEFHDIYDVLEFQLPGEQRNWLAAELKQRIKVPLRLVRHNSSEDPQLWVLRDNGLDQVEQLVQNSDDQLLSRFAFAVAESNGDKLVIIRARSVRDPVPPLVFSGVAYRPYRRIPNLFVPINQRIHPPLRRDALTGMFATEGQRLCWLHPLEHGQFKIETIEDWAFRPLAEWVDYVLDENRQALTAWIESHQFKFDSFITDMDLQAKEKPKTLDRKLRSTKVETASSPSEEVTRPTSVEVEVPASDAEVFEAIRDDRSQVDKQLQERLRELESDFLELDDPLDSDERQKLWRAMGVLNARLSRRADMTLCWSNAIWGRTDTELRELARMWFDCELACSSHEEFGPADIENLSTSDSKTPPSLLASYIVHHFANQGEYQSLFYGIGQRLLQEQSLPMRTVWQTWRAICNQGEGDPLGLARARDQILARLFKTGLTAESDLPKFVRSGSSGDDRRLEAVRESIRIMQGTVDSWIVEPPKRPLSRTRTYAKLMFSFAFARLGDGSDSRRLLDEAQADLARTDDPIHNWFAAAFEFRVLQALTGDVVGPLSESALNTASEMDRNSRFILDRFRDRSLILEPHERTAAFTQYHKGTDPLGLLLLELQGVRDTSQIQRDLDGLLTDTEQSSDSQFRIAQAALEFSPRLGQSFGLSLLTNQVPQLLRTKSDLPTKSMLLERALFAAGHFGLTAMVEELLDSFRELLPQLVTEYLGFDERPSMSEKLKIKDIELLFSQSFRRAARLGMGDKVDLLFSLVNEQLQAESARGRIGPAMRARRQKLRLCLASTWLYFGESDRTSEILSEVRAMLIDGDLETTHQLSLAVSYVQTAALAPTEEAINRIEELFAIDESNGEQRLKRITDNFFTATHYSITQLELIEATLVALVSEDLTLDAKSRRWLDADEFFVRQQIHKDMQAIL